MKVQNVRLGFATNSSSSHSMIFVSKPQQESNYAQGQGFHWDDFVLTSEKAKRAYLAALLNSHFRPELPAKIMRSILKGLKLPAIDQTVDHQSAYTFPLEQRTTATSLEFFEDFKKYVLQENLVILGGNDNENLPIDIQGEYTPATLEFMPDTPYSYCRKDGDWWTLMTTTGDRVTFSFLSNPDEFKPKTPMLVDLKITNFCTHGCKFCYQDSTPSGVHANTYDVSYIIHSLAEGGVFEVAIGGGEPTEHPDFFHILEQAAYLKLNISFTTRGWHSQNTPAWALDPRKLRILESTVSGIGISVTSEAEMQNVLEHFDKNPNLRSKIVFHIIPELLKVWELRGIFRYSKENHARLLLLGYKQIGRAGDLTHLTRTKEDKDWIDIALDTGATHFCIDTSLAAQYKQKLASQDIPDWMYHVEEGLYSMYIDAVDKKFGPSSYHTSELTPYGKGYQTTNLIQKWFAQVPVSNGK